ncbi:sodium/potassium/calcium exchanger Nckx30C isoform X3 [Musca domestica]|uniref:Sodium/potassium/calcium exchanger Nckx30C isoform X3 n=1 Tax=Musca domestica TaxID=7370 RepID=A0A9J7DN98_MUSDO|nr:sodium/potassium/calcium exchanger Nckx30C isoform X3 [Musca domestica]
MLQQHNATCLLSATNLVNTQTVTPPAQRQHEILETKPTSTATTANLQTLVAAEGITLGPLQNGGNEQQQQLAKTNENVALHSSVPKNKLPTTTTFIPILKNGSYNNAQKQTKNNNNNQNSSQGRQLWHVVGSLDDVKNNDFPDLTTKMKAQILYQTPSLLTEATTAAATKWQQQQTLSKMLHDHIAVQSLLKPIIDFIPKSIKESLDFNSRRRRGRLRPAKAETGTETETETVAAASRTATPSTSSARAARRRSNVPATFVQVNKFAKQLTTLLLTLLLSFLSITFVNKHNSNNNLVLSLNKILKNKNRKKSNPADDDDGNDEAEIKGEQIPIHRQISSHNNNKNTTTTSSSVFSSNGTSRLLYALLFFAILLIIPSHDHMVSAAKPKSATQLQQQQQQQHQDHNQQQQHHNNKPNIAYAAGADHVQIDKEGMLLTPPSYQGVSSQTSNEEGTEYLTDSEEQLFDDEKQNLNIVEEEDAAEEDMDRGSYEKDGNDTHFDNTTVTKTPLFPTDLFTKEQLENGAVICHIIGVIYMFVALAIVCDEFFVPSLDVIIEKLGITDDVAGATFMAAGGSAPELFTSVIGVFVSFDDVGIGTIVGSAVFNILFVIGMCALFSRTVLSLTWWPLFRDCTFYSVSLLVLIYFFRDNRIWWWEALILFCIYIGYVGFMKWNVQVEGCVKKLISKNKGNAANSSETSMATQPGGSMTSRAASETRSGPPGSSSGAGTTGNSSGGNASTTQTGAKFRHGLLQLMIHTIDPLHDDDVPGKVDEKATQLHAIASLKVLLDATKPQRGGATTSAANHVKINLKETTLADRPNGNIDTTLDSPSLSGRRASWIDQRVKIQTRKFSIKQTQEIEDEPEPLSMAWPDTARKRLTYILVAPLLIPMWLTLPDTRTPKGKKLFPITFIGSILWIAAFSYLMVWWANVAGDTARIPPEVMGLTFLAAGTSIPDLITSVIVARKGFGDMAVSSSVGSNIFDVTVGLPIPWLLYGIIYDAPVEVNSVGMVCSITILFMMLLFVVMSIACFHWRMNKGLGFTMFLLYFVFVAVSLMFEYDVITCPV